MRILLTKAEAHLLKWLAESVGLPFGACHGAVLDQLIIQGLVRIEPSFVNFGYAWVTITAKGRETFKEIATEVKS